jgi:hypothetical protein
LDNVLVYSGGNLIVDSGVTLTTNGYFLAGAGNFVNNGIIETGTINNGGMSDHFNGFDLNDSYGGSGGGGSQDNRYVSGGSGGDTLVNGGADCDACNYPNGANGGSGSSPAAPTLTSSLLTSWYDNGFQNYTGGAGGGCGYGSGNTCYLPGGDGAGGIYIQFPSIMAGNIFSNASSLGEVIGYSSGSGAGGGGIIVLAYNTSIINGTYNYSGGIGMNSGIGISGGNGGNGNVFTFNYGNDLPVSYNSRG